jgi:hypothetical protein
MPIALFEKRGWRPAGISVPSDCRDAFRKESSLHILGNRNLLLGHFPFFNHSVSFLLLK